MATVHGLGAPVSSLMVPRKTASCAIAEMVAVFKIAAKSRPILSLITAG
jgi:hypothetical protein